MTNSYVSVKASQVREKCVRYVWGNRAYAQRYYNRHVGALVGKRAGFLWRKKISTLADAKAHCRIDEWSQVNNMHEMTEHWVKLLYEAALDNRRVCVPVCSWVKLNSPHDL